jgi:hypothetical protein
VDRPHCQDQRPHGLPQCRPEDRSAGGPEVLLVQELGEEIIDPQTKVSLGRAPGNIKGEVLVTGFFGKDGSVATTTSGGGFNNNDLVRLKK